MRTLNGTGQQVTVVGLVGSDGERVRLTPSLPTGITTPTGLSVAVVGDLPAPAGDHVSVDGVLTGDELLLTGWHNDPGPDALYRFLRTVDGVPREVATAVSHPGVEQNLISTGMTIGRTGGWARVIHLAWATEDDREWVARQPPESVYLHGFVRGDGLSALLTPPTAARVTPPDQDRRPI